MVYVEVELEPHAFVTSTLDRRKETVTVVAEGTVWFEIFEEKNYLPLPEMEQLWNCRPASILVTTSTVLPRLFRCTIQLTKFNP